MIEGYTTTTSVAQGEMIGICVNNTARSSEFSLDIYRLPNRVEGLHGTTARAIEQRTTVDAHANGCNWDMAYSLTLPASWRSGIYEARLTNADGETTNIAFVLRAAQPGLDSKILFCLPVTTYQAYNSWGGKNLYDSASTQRSRRVSFDRPTDGPWDWEYRLYEWMERSGYAAECCTSIDLHTDSQILDRYRILLSTGHDEYWSKEMRDHVEAFIGRGGNLACFSANTCWWQVRFEDNARTMVCYKSALEDPLTGVDDSRVTVNWHSAPVNRPENWLTGVSFLYGAGNWSGRPTALAALKNAAYCVRTAQHWLFAGTGLRNGDFFAGGCVGYETDCADYFDTKTGETRLTGNDAAPIDFEILATADLGEWRDFGQGGKATLGFFTNGGTVFTTGTVAWSYGLDDPIIQEITRNVLDRLSQPALSERYRLPTFRIASRQWEKIGEAERIIALCATIEGKLFAVDDHDELLSCDALGAQREWARTGNAGGVIAMTAPVLNIGRLFGVTSDGALLWRSPLPQVEWERVGNADNVIALACPFMELFAVRADQRLGWLDLKADEKTTRRVQWQSIIRVDAFYTPEGRGWQLMGTTPNLVALAHCDGKLLGGTSEAQVVYCEPLIERQEWIALCDLPAPLAALTAYYGKLFVVTQSGELWWRAAVK